MKTNSTAPKLEQKNELPMLQVVPPEKEVKTEAPAEEVKSETAPLPEETAPPAKVEAVKPQPTIEEIKRKNEILRRLTQRYDEVSLKLFKIENFKISSDRETSSVFLTDANGESFQSNSPKTVQKVIQFWTDEFKNALSEIEKEIRENA